MTVRPALESLLLRALRDHNGEAGRREYLDAAEGASAGGGGLGRRLMPQEGVRG